MQKGLKIILWIIAAPFIIWGLYVGWQVFQKFRPRFFSFSNTGTVVDEKTGKGIPDVYVFLLASGQDEIDFGSIAPEGSHGGGASWYSGTCKSVRVVKTDANGQYRYSISPWQGFDYPWPYSVGVNRDFHHPKYFYNFPRLPDISRAPEIPVQSQDDAPDFALRYFSQKRMPDCEKYFYQGGELKNALASLLTSKLEQICLNVHLERQWDTKGKYVVVSYPQNQAYLNELFIRLAKNIDQVNADNPATFVNHGPLEEQWRQVATSYLGSDLFTPGDDKRPVAVENVQRACNLFSKKISEVGVMK
jgi:hypothetical protein